MAEVKDGCASCPYETIIEELKRDSERNSTQHKEFYDKFSEQSTAIAISTERYQNLLQVINEIKVSVDKVGTSIQEITTKPAKRWEAVVSTAIGCIVTAIVVYALSKIGL